MDHRQSPPVRAGRLAAPALFLFLFAGSVHAAYKCVDEKGVTHYGDPLPAQCLSKAFSELSNQGTVKAKTDRPLTAEELKQRQDDEVKFKDERRKEAEQQRRDRALLATYGAEKEIDFSRDRAIEQVSGRLKSAEVRLKEMDEKIAKLSETMESYKAGKSSKGVEREPPAYLKQSFEQSKADRAALVETMAKMEEEKKSVAAQYDTDKQRWKDLKSGKVVLQVESKPGAPGKKGDSR